ncbi:MAG TPA: hypothetical protein VIH78_03840 [Terriglobales bacterium]
MQRLYQWLIKRASFFRHDAAGYSASSSVRTETMVRRERVTLLAGSAAALGIDICPFCGSNLAPAEEEEATRHPPDRSIAQEASSVKNHPP